MKKFLLRLLLILPAFLLQAMWLYVIWRWLTPYASLLNTLLTILAFCYVVFIINLRQESNYKLMWLLAFLVAPVAGAFLYLCFGNRRAGRHLRARLKRSREELAKFKIGRPESVTPELEAQDRRMGQTFRYLSEQSGYPVLSYEGGQYFAQGEAAWQQMLADLRQAERFIFVEYFIIEPGVMWDSMVEVMAEKVREGVDVRVLYDDVGSFMTYSGGNLAALRKHGIKCVQFNPLVFIRGAVNYRDHRKMLIVDGKVVFSGGINLADEYINRVEKHGYWKDNCFRLTGEPVKSFVRMYVEFWNAFAKDKIVPRQLKLAENAVAPAASGGYVLSYYDSPMNEQSLSNNLYIELLGQAEKTAWFLTPYLIMGDSLMEAFMRAAERGVDVRIIMPGVPDKRLVFRMSRSYYPTLLAAGVKIYEYKPGFAHGKGCVIDDKVGVLGTVNLDYRSLFLHFENNSLFYKADLLADLRADFLATQKRCRQRTLKNMKMTWYKYLLDGLLKIIAPLC